MARLILPSTIGDSDWFDANPLMANFLAIKNLVNGGLDSENVSASTRLSVGTVHVSDNIDTPFIAPTGDFSIRLSKGKAFEIVSGINSNFTIDNNGTVTFAGIFQTLPIGTIIPFDGVFTNNVTLPGWYVCDGTNETRNLTSRFVRGDSVAGGTGGTNNAALVTHTHPSSSTGFESATHTHSISGSSASSVDTHYHVFTFDEAQGGTILIFGVPPSTQAVDQTAATSSSNAAHTHSFTASSDNNSATHTHTVTVQNAGSAAATNMPRYRSAVFIQRIS